MSVKHGITEILSIGNASTHTHTHTHTQTYIRYTFYTFVFDETYGKAKLTTDNCIGP